MDIIRRIFGWPHVLKNEEIEPEWDLDAFKHLLRSDAASLMYDSGRELHKFNLRVNHFDQIYVKYAGKQVAYIFSNSLILEGEDRYLKTEHFAVEKDFVGLGIGRVLAIEVAKIFIKKHQINKIIFSEYSTVYDEFYPPFFEAIGAVPVDVRLQKRPDWHWDVTHLNG